MTKTLILTYKDFEYSELLTSTASNQIIFLYNLNAMINSPKLESKDDLAIKHLPTGSRESLDNEAINSLTVTIVTVSIVALALLGALVYLVIFLVHKKQ